MRLKQLYLSFYFISLIAAISLAIAGYWAINKISNSLDNLITYSSAERASQDADMMHDAIRADVFNMLITLQDADDDAIKTIAEDIQANKKRLLDNMSLVAKFDASKQFTEELKAVNPKVDAYILAASEIASIASGDQTNLSDYTPDSSNAQKTKLNNAKSSNNSKAADIKNRLPRFLSLYSELAEGMEKLSNRVQASSLTTEGMTTTTTNLSEKTIIIVTLLTITTLILLGWFVNKKQGSILGKEPELLHEIANRIADGNLSEVIAVKAGDKNSLLASMQKMQSNLRYLIAQIQVSAESINNGAQEISAGNTNLSQRTEEQASSLEEDRKSVV